MGDIGWVVEGRKIAGTSALATGGERGGGGKGKGGQCTSPSDVGVGALLELRKRDNTPLQNHQGPT